MASRRDKRKRRVAFADEVDIADKKSKESESLESKEERKSRFKAKHSLDSDEEDDIDEVQQDGLGDEDLGAQEDTTIIQDGDIRVTPFNLEEEMEEGYFDSHGNYYEKKDPDAIRDSWLDEVDWTRVQELHEWEGGKEERGDDREEEELSPVDKVAVYKQIMNILKPGETVVKALARLGSSRSLSASERLKLKKKKSQSGQKPSSSQSEEEDRSNVDILTGCADKLVAIGDYSIYEDTYERIRFKLEKEEKAAEPVDMFSDVVASSTAVKPLTAPVLSDEVMWEYRWKNEDDQEIHGPFSSTQMNQWVSENYFPEGVWVRRVNVASSQFYSSKRIDFDLYS